MPKSSAVTPPLSDQLQQLYSAIGEATTSWMAVEDQLANLFAYFVAGNGMSFPAKAAFHATVNFNIKLAMTDAAARWHMRLDQKRWNTFFNRINRTVKKRNQLAHFSVIRSASIPGGDVYLRLASSLGNVDAQLQTTAASGGGLSVKDVLQRAGSFKKLAADLGKLCVEIGAIHPVQLEESLSRLLRLDEGNMVRSEENQTHIEPQPQPSPSQE